MNICWQKLLFKTSFWLATEIILNLVGIDDLADYSEFVYENKNFGCISAITPMI